MNLEWTKARAARFNCKKEDVETQCATFFRVTR